VNDRVELIRIEQVEIEPRALALYVLGRQSHGDRILRKGCHIGLTCGACQAV
jgi:hypothetical protein